MNNQCTLLDFLVDINHYRGTILYYVPDLIYNNLEAQQLYAIGQARTSWTED